MLDRIIQFSIQNKLIIALFVLFLVGFGAFELKHLPIDAVPDITDNQVQVITVSPALGAPDIERLITFPIEQATTTIHGLKEMRSFSRFGLSLVTLVFNDDVDVYFARQQVSERLQQIGSAIPKELGVPELAPITTGLGEIYQYVVRTTDEYRNFYTLEDLREIQDWIIRRQLLGVEGVADVSSFGGKLKQYHIKVDPNALRSYNLSISQVFEALQANNQNTGGAYIEKGSSVLFIRSEGLLQNIHEIETVPVAYHDSGTPILVRDIGKVEISHATRYGAMTYNDEGETVGAVVMMLKGANSNLVIEKVKERISEIQKSLPKGVFIEPFLDRTKMVNNAISTVETNLLEGALIVVFVLVLFLGNLRAGFIVASIIPLSMLFAVIMMNFFGVSGNLMSLGALDFGLIVDGAVIIVEAVLHRLTHSKVFKNISQLNQKEMDVEVAQSAGKMMNSAVFGQIIILIVYLPIFTLEGIEGKMFKPMAQTVMFALIGAFILSMTYIPMITSLVLSKKISHTPSLSDRFMAWLEQRFQAFQLKALRYRSILFVTVSLVFFISVWILANMGGEFIPALEEGDFAVDTRVLTGSNLNTTIENTQKTAGLLKERFPEVIKVVTKIGSGEIPTDPMPIEASDMMVILKPKKEWTSAQSFPELAEKMSEALSEVPGVTTGFQFPVQMRFNELMTGARQDVVCKIYGEDLDTLAHYAKRLGDLAGNIEGARDVYVEPITGLPQIVIRPKREALLRYQLTISDVNQLVETALAGSSAGMIYEGERRFDLIIKIKDEKRNSIQDIKQLLIPTKNGSQIPLQAVADVQIEVGPNQIQREDAKRRIVVGFNVRGRDVQSIVTDLQTAVDTQLNLPAGYYVTYGGAFENLEAAKWRLAIAVPVALGLIFLLLYFAFGSIRKGLLIYTAIPLSAIGGIFALYTRGMPFSISAGIGFIALFGVAVLNGIVLIAEFSRLKESGYTDVKRIVIQGTKVRLRPVLMTAAVASLGFLPMALSKGSGAEVQRPLATVVIGGLIVATFLTLFVLPALYSVFESREFEKNYPILAKIKVLIPLMLVLGASELKAQESMSFSEALKRLESQNLSIKQQKLLLEAARFASKTAWNIPKTEFNAEIGQFNSFKTDTRLGIEQQLAFPLTYLALQKEGEAKVALSETEIKLLKKRLEANLQQVFYQLVILDSYKNELNMWMHTLDSLTAKVQIQFDAGAINAQERTALFLMREQVRMEFQQVEILFRNAQLELSVLLQLDVIPPLTNSRLYPIRKPVAAVVSESHPYLEKLKNETALLQAQRNQRVSQWYPNLRLGLYPLTFIGMPDANGNTLTSSDRFTSFLVGVQVPLFFGATSNEVKRANRAIKVQELNEQEKVFQFTKEQERVLETYNLLYQQVQHLESKVKPEIELLRIRVLAQFNAGHVTLSESMVLVRQITDSYQLYYHTLLQFSKTSAELAYLTDTKEFIYE